MQFKFEHDLDNVEWAVDTRGIDERALYFVDAWGRIRHHRFGERDYERSEMVIRQLLAEAGVEDLQPGLATITPHGDEVQAEWEDLGSSDSYLGYGQATRSTRVTAVRHGTNRRTMQRLLSCGSTTGTDRNLERPPRCGRAQ